MHNWQREIRTRVEGLNLEPTREAEIVEELTQHLEDRYRDLLAAGASERESISAVLAELRESEVMRKEMQRIERAKEFESIVPGARNGHLFGDLLQDLRYGYRSLLRSPGFTAVTLLTLALGIGANTSIFGLIDAVLLKTLPVAEPSQLFFVENMGARGGGGSPPYPCFERFRDNNEHLTGIAAVSGADVKLSIDGQIEQATGQYASGNYFDLLGIKPIAGRTFSSVDDSIIGQGGPDGAVAVIGYNYWQRRFAGSPSAIGRVIQFGKIQATIIGVTPPNFFGISPGRDVDINFPMMLADRNLLTDSGSWWFEAFGRMKPGSSVEQARADLDRIFQAFMNERSSIGEMRRDYFDHIELNPAAKGQRNLRGRYLKPLVTLKAAVGVVLLIACANVANLLLARGAARRREFAVRLALGASRFRLIRQLLTESLLLVLAGGLLGLVLANWTSGWLMSFFSGGRGQIHLNLSLDLRLLSFTFFLALLTGIIFSLVPALKTVRLDPGPVLKDNSANISSDRSRLRIDKLLVIAQVALSLALLVGGGLFLQSLLNLKHLDAGFQPQGVLIMNVDVGARDYGKPQLMNFWRETLARIQGIAGVNSASLSELSPIDGRKRGILIEVPGFTAESQQDNAINLNPVSPGYFSTMGINIRRGRVFNEADDSSKPRVAVLNETAARFYFGERDPIGQIIRVTIPRDVGACEIIGIVRDSKYSNLREEIPRLLYLPLLQPIRGASQLTLAAHTSGDPLALTTPIRTQLREMGSDILITNAVTLSEQVNQSLLEERLVSSLSSVFALLALLLACIGLYGVITYTVSGRMNEFGIRLALGATPTNLLSMVLKESLVLVLLGIAIGVPASLAAKRLIATMLFGMSSGETVTIIVAVVLMLGVAAVAALIPSLKASRVDPLLALRCE